MEYNSETVPPMGQRKSVVGGDRSLLTVAALIAVGTLVGSWFGVHYSVKEILRYEAEESARAWATFLRDDLPGLPTILKGEGVSERDRRTIDAASHAGNIFRFKFFGPDGLIVHASRKADKGQTNTKWYFVKLVRNGKVFSKIETEEDFGQSRKSVSEAYVPIMEGDLFLGAIEVYVDVTPRAIQLDWLGNRAFLILVAFTVFVTIVIFLLVRRNIRRHVDARESLELGQEHLKVTQRHLLRSKEDAERAKAEAESADRAKSEFLAVMSHEIRTPMNGCLGMVSMLLRTDLTPTQRHYCDKIKQSGDSLLRILNSILDLSKIEAGQFEIEDANFRLASVVEDVTAVFESRARQKGLNFEVELAPELPEALKGDPGRIRQILANYVSNSIKFADAGTICIHVSSREGEAGTYEIRFDVTDSGSGIAPEDQSRLFEKFTQVDGSSTRNVGGTGLGLAICKELAELMGGTAGVASDLGQGSTFWFTICCNLGSLSEEQRSFSERPTGQMVRSETARPLRILVAEDNAVNQEIAAATLEFMGHQADVVANGLEAVEAVQNFQYDVVLMDIHMPEMDGIAATRVIRNLDGEVSKIPIVALTADAMLGDREKYLSAGMNNYLSKPFDEGQLDAIIQRLTSRS